MGREIRTGPQLTLWSLSMLLSIKTEISCGFIQAAPGNDKEVGSCDIWLVAMFSFRLHKVHTLKERQVPPCLGCTESTELVWDKRHSCPAYSPYSCILCLLQYTLPIAVYSPNHCILSILQQILPFAINFPFCCILSLLRCWNGKAEVALKGCLRLLQVTSNICRCLWSSPPMRQHTAASGLKSSSHLKGLCLNGKSLKQEPIMSIFIRSTIQCIK